MTGVNNPGGRICVASQPGGSEASSLFSGAWGLVPQGSWPRKVEAAGANHWLPLQEAPAGSGGGLALPFQQLCTLLLSLPSPAVCIGSLETAGDQPAGPEILVGTCILPDRQLLSVPALAPATGTFVSTSSRGLFHTLLGGGGLLCSQFPGNSKR